MIQNKKRDVSWPMYSDQTDDPVVTGYMCMIDWECELGIASGGNTIYSSVEDHKRCHPCWEECGIVEVEVRFKRIVSESAVV